MRRQLKLSVCVACLAVLSTALTAQTPSPATTAPAATPATAPDAAAPGRRGAAQPGPPSLNIPTGTPVGVATMQNHNSVGQPTPNTVDGQPIETRAPELADDHPVVPGTTRAPYHATAPYNVTTITDKLKAPWSLQFLPDGKMLVTEKTDGQLVTVDAQGDISQPITGLPPIASGGQVGLLDVALDPHFAKNHRIFFSYSEPVTQFGSPIASSGIALARATYNEAAGSLSDVTVIFRAKPALPRTRGNNQGGRIAIGRDGNLFMTVGDRSNSPPWDVAQRLDTDLGKIIHITPDGAPAKNNPFLHTAGALPEIWSIGHRSEEGLTIDPATGKLWETENGPRGGDKLLQPQAGKNYGWPLYVHGIDYPGEVISGGAVQAAGTEQPIYYWDPVLAPSGLAIYRGKLFPQWKGSVLAGGMRGEMIDRLGLSGNKVVNEEPLLFGLAKMRDVRVGPEGAVYVLTEDGKLLKLTPK